MIKLLYSLLNKFYETFAPHVDYTLDKNENIVKIEKNKKLGSSHVIYAFASAIVIIIIMSVIGVIVGTIELKENKKVFQNKYKVQQICVETSTWTECFGNPHEEHVGAYDAEDFERLGYTVVTAGTKDTYHSSLMAWKHKT